MPSLCILLIGSFTIYLNEGGQEMKRIIALLLITMLAISMVGCSDGGKKSSDGTGTDSEKVVNNSSNDSDENADNKEENGDNEDSNGDNNEDNNDDSYTMYDDLPNYENVLFHEIYISTPAWRNDETIYGNRLSDSNDYVIAITYNDDDEKYTGTLDDILEFTYKGFTNAVGEHAVTNEFGEYNLTTKEKVMLDCGVEAIKFEGTMSANEYSAVVDYYVYGYSFLYDEVALTVGASIVNPDVIDENKDTMKDIVDRMVKTIRTQP